MKHVFSAAACIAIGAFASRMSNSLLGTMACLPPKQASYDLRGTMFTLCESVHREAAGEQTTTCKLAMRWYVHTTGGVLNTSNKEAIAASNSQTTILFSHGNAVDAGQCHDFCSELAAMTGCNMIIWDYHSYGLSDKHAFCEQNMYRGIKSVYESVLRLVPSHNIFLFGKSLGSVPTIWLAAQRETTCNGVILVSPLASGARTLCNLNGFPSSITHWADGVFADSIERIGIIARPVMIIHGTQDEIVPVQNALDLYEQLPDLPNLRMVGDVDGGAAEQDENKAKKLQTRHKLLLLPAGHNDIEILFGSEYVRELLKFMNANVAYF